MNEPAIDIKDSDKINTLRDEIKYLEDILEAKKTLLNKLTGNTSEKSPLMTKDPSEGEILRIIKDNELAQLDNLLATFPQTLETASTIALDYHYQKEPRYEIIKYLIAKKLKLIKDKLEKEVLIDASTKDPLNNPITLPSGYTFNKETLLPRAEEIQIRDDVYGVEASYKITCPVTERIFDWDETLDKLTNSIIRHYEFDRTHEIDIAKFFYELQKLLAWGKTSEILATPTKSSSEKFYTSFGNSSYNQYYTHIVMEKFIKEVDSAKPYIEWAHRIAIEEIAKKYRKFISRRYSRHYFYIDQA